MVDLEGVATAECNFLEHEHRELAAGVEQIHHAACSAGHTSSADLHASVRRVCGWIGGVLIPHAAWEDKVVYAHVDSAAGTKWATKLMRFEHYQIERAAVRLTSDLERLSSPVTMEEVSAMRCHLFSLEAMIRAHLEREELFLMPLLEDSLEKPSAKS